MSLTIESSRFGRVEIDPGSVIEFPDGLIGLSGSRYALLARDPDTPFLWLQSLEDPALALPVTNPHQFFSQFTVEVTDEDAERDRSCRRGARGLRRQPEGSDPGPLRSRLSGDQPGGWIRTPGTAVRRG